MPLFLNPSRHWQIPDGPEIHTGDRLQVLIQNEWIWGHVEYRPIRGYILRLEDRQELDLCPDLTIKFAAVP